MFFFKKKPDFKNVSQRCFLPWRIPSSQLSVTAFFCQVLLFVSLSLSHSCEWPQKGRCFLRSSPPLFTTFTPTAKKRGRGEKRPLWRLRMSAWNFKSLPHSSHSASSPKRGRGRRRKEDIPWLCSWLSCDFWRRVGGLNFPFYSARKALREGDKRSPAKKKKKMKKCLSQSFFPLFFVR